MEHTISPKGNDRYIFKFNAKARKGLIKLLQVLKHGDTITVEFKNADLVIDADDTYGIEEHKYD